MPEIRFGRIFALTSRAFHNLAGQVFPQLGLHRGQVAVLLELSDLDGCTQSELVEQLEITPATLTNLLNRMEEAGFITRLRDPDDLRISRVYLSEMGNAIMEQAVGLAKQIDSKALAGLSSEEQETLHELLERVHTNLTTPSNP